MATGQRESFVRRRGYPRFALDAKALLDRDVVERDLQPLISLLNFGSDPATYIAPAAAALWKLMEEIPAALGLDAATFACGFVPAAGCSYTPEVIAPLVRWHAWQARLYDWAVSTASGPGKTPDYPALKQVGDDLVELLEEMDEFVRDRLRFWLTRKASE